jgi:hypothetical protein
MDILLQTQFKYKIDEPLENVQSEIRALLSSSWRTFSKNIRGRLREDNSFTVLPKFTIPIRILGTNPDYALLEGKLSFEEGRTIIRLTARPSYLMIFAFYFLLILLCADLITLKKPLSIESFIRPIALAVVVLILFGVLSYSMKRIRNRFERFMGIRMKQ